MMRKAPDELSTAFRKRGVKMENESIEQLRKENQELRARLLAQENRIQVLEEEVYRVKGELFCDKITTDHAHGIVEADAAIETTDLSAEQIERYSRQLLLNDGFGVNGQRQLLSSKVLVIGAGGIGSTGEHSLKVATAYGVLLSGDSSRYYFSL